MWARGGETRLHLSTTINSDPAGSPQVLSLLSTDKWQALVDSLLLVATIGVSGMARSVCLRGQH